MDTTTLHAIAGCLLGTAAGDAMGLPFEGLSPRRRLFSDADSHHFLFGRGMVSDDTEHTCLVANALIESAGDEDIFRRQLARGLRTWLLTLPAAAGLATLKAASRLCVGVGPERSGVYSAGNGPAMRSALIGVCYGHDPMRLRNLVRISTRATHIDPKAEYAALSVAIAAHLSARGTTAPDDYYSAVRAAIGGADGEFLQRLRLAVESARDRVSTPAFAASLGLQRGPSGYCMESVPVALHAWLLHPADLRAAVAETIQCGGDTDTMAAITGGIVGAHTGAEAIPDQWIDGLCDWPRTRKWLEAQARVLAEVAATGQRQRAPSLPYVPLVMRNIVFASVAVAHGFRRLLPPY